MRSKQSCPSFPRENIGDELFCPAHIFPGGQEEDEEIWETESPEESLEATQRWLEAAEK